jgi:CheY-like chemotaxis protein
LDVKAVDLVAIVKQSIETMQHAAAYKKIALKFNTESVVCLVSADQARIQQVMANLIANAIKFSEKNSEIAIRLREEGGEVTVSVQDQGVGIESEFLPSVFERFTQASATQTRASGLGLGLSIVKSLIEMHKGRVKALSDGKGKGAEFSFTLPVYSTQNDVPDLGRAGGADDVLVGKKILVLEDDPDTREMLALVLRQNGAEVCVAENVPEALEAFRTSVPDVCISDIGLPGQDGYDFISEVRKLPREHGGETPVLAVTAFARTEDKRKALASGFNAYLSKPVDLRSVIDTVQSL